MGKLFENKIGRSGEGDSAAALLDALFREFKVIDSRTPSAYISPSSLNCPVACVFKLQGIEVPPEKQSFQSRSFAENGEDRHTRIQDFLSQTEYWVDVAEFIKKKNLPLVIVEKQEHEVLLVSEKYRTRFKCDGILLINGEYYILEIKTERGSVTVKRNEPDKKHYLQGVAYTMLFDIGKIMWCYEGRDYLEQRLFVQDVTSTEKEQVSTYLTAILENIEKPEALPRNESACRYCSYKKYCKMYFNEIKRKEMEALWGTGTNSPTRR